MAEFQFLYRDPLNRFLLSFGCAVTNYVKSKVHTYLNFGRSVISQKPYHILYGTEDERTGIVCTRDR